MTNLLKMILNIFWDKKFIQYLHLWYNGDIYTDTYLYIMWKTRFQRKTKPWYQNKKQSTKKKKPAPYQVQDMYFQMAKREWYRARSVYKLKEIQEQFGLIEPDMNVCDVGAAPGSFIQYMKRIIGQQWIIVGIDIQPINKYSQPNIYTLEHDIFELETLQPKVDSILASHSSESRQFDLITSDIAPKTTGRKDVDQYASVELNIEILRFANVFLRPWGNLLLKVFKGEDFWDLTSEIKKYFQKFTEYKPQACRDRSFEEYVICYWKK